MKSQKGTQKGTKKLKKAGAKSPKPKSESGDRSRSLLQNWLQLAQLRAEKCELKEARVAYLMALKQAKKLGEMRAVMEALAGLLRLAGEALDEEAIKLWDQELDAFMASHPKQVPAMAWYCKGVVARYQKLPRLAQRYFHCYLRAVRKDPKSASYGFDTTAEEAIAKGWYNLAVILVQRNRVRRSHWIAKEILRRYEDRGFRGVNGFYYLLLGEISERHRNFEEALGWFQKAHATFLAQHNWYIHLAVMLRYARLNRLQQNYSQTYWYLDLLDKACQAPEFGLLKREVAAERGRLEQDAVDLLIDARDCAITTRDTGTISLGKQYVLLHILEALSKAHSKQGEDMDRGLSKSEIIEQVWKESYRPEAHDNKLYYNINRLRKLIEPDIRKPQYLLNWKEGYRLAPGLRIRFVGGRPATGSPNEEAI